jgi:hypothetical protein
MEKIHVSYSLYFIFLSRHTNAMHPGLSANTPQLPFDIIIGRKDIVLQSLENLFENLDIVATQINFLWNHHALCKHQVKAFIPLELKITQSGPFNSCPSCFGAELGEFTDS